jgi:hypothetical protein
MRKVMKKSILIFVAVLVLSLVACGEERTVTVVLDDPCGPERQSVAREIIGRRMASLWRVKELGELSDGRFTVTYSGSGNDSLLTPLLAQRGEFFVAETYPTIELESALMEAFDASALFPTEVYNSVLLRCLEADRPMVDSVLTAHREIFPADAVFYWADGRDAYGNKCFELLAVRGNRYRHLPLNPETVERSLVGGKELVIEFREPYASEWARLTRENIDRSLAFVLDGRVLLFPRVMEEITGGKTFITGPFSEGELILFRSFALGGLLDCPARVENNRE